MSTSMTDREQEIYRTLLKCDEKMCLFGFECPYSKYEGLCKKHLMRDAADTIKAMSRMRKDCV